MGHVRDRWFTQAGEPTARHGSGLRYQVKYRVDGREQDGGSYGKKSDAKRRLVELEASLLRGQWVDPSDQTTVTEWVRRNVAARVLKPRTQLRLESTIRNHIEPTPLGSRRLARVRPSEAQEWIKDRAKHLAPSTLRLTVTLLRGAFSAAVLDHLATSNPFQNVTLPRGERERIVPLTVAQVQAVIDAVAPRYKAMVTAQAGLGLRLGEVLALRVEDVAFLGRSVRIEHQVDRITRTLVDPKTPRSRRTLPLPDVVSTALAAHMQQFPPTGSGLLFHASTGRPMLHDWYQSRVFVPAAIKAGLPRGTTSHSLRHHYASVLLAAGESVVAVAERLGHDNATLVLSTYGHLLPDTEDRTRRAVDDAWKVLSEKPAAAQELPR